MTSLATVDVHLSAKPNPGIVQQIQRNVKQKFGLLATAPFVLVLDQPAKESGAPRPNNKKEAKQNMLFAIVKDTGSNPFPTGGTEMIGIGWTEEKVKTKGCVGFR